MYYPPLGIIEKSESEDVLQSLITASIGFICFSMSLAIVKFFCSKTDRECLETSMDPRRLSFSRRKREAIISFTGRKEMSGPCMGSVMNHLNVCDDLCSRKRNPSNDYEENSKVEENGESDVVEKKLLDKHKSPRVRKGSESQKDPNSVDNKKKKKMTSTLVKPEVKARMDGHLEKSRLEAAKLESLTERNIHLEKLLEEKKLEVKELKGDLKKENEYKLKCSSDLDHEIAKNLDLEFDNNQLKEQLAALKKDLESQKKEFETQKRELERLQEHNKQLTTGIEEMNTYLMGYFDTQAQIHAKNSTVATESRESHSLLKPLS